MSRRKKKTQVQGRCIFCNGTRLTKEHVWSDWLKGILPASVKHEQKGLSFENDHVNRASSTYPHSRSFQGPLHKRKIRQVCSDCNNGWMSRIVELAKPYATPMIMGEGVVLDANAQRNIAAWISISNIVAERTDIRSAMIPPSDCTSLMQTNVPPTEWTILLGRTCSNKWASHTYRHHGIDYNYVIDESNIPLLDGPDSDKFHLSTHVLGELLIHIFGGTDRDLRDVCSIFVTRFDLIQIWPLKWLHIDWPTTGLLGTVETDAVANGFISQINYYDP